MSTRKPGTGGKILAEVAANWPTPDTDCNRPKRSKGKREAIMSGLVKDKQLNLADAAVLFPTPAARDYRAPNSAKHANQARGHRGQLPNFIAHRFFLPGQTTSSDGRSSSDSTPKLNPQFVEFLMGFPLVWTDCGASAMVWFPLWLHLHSLRLRELSHLLAGTEEQ